MVRRPLLTAALCAVLAALVYVVAVRVPLAREADLRTLEGFMGLWTVPGASFAGAFVGLFNPLPFALLTAGAARLRGRDRPRRARAPRRSSAMLGAGVTTQVLKPLLAVQRDFPVWHYMGPEAYPSGHTTAVMSFALALAIVAPPRLRPLAAAAGALLDRRHRLLDPDRRLALPERRDRRLPGRHRVGVPGRDPAAARDAAEPAQARRRPGDRGRGAGGGGRRRGVAGARRARSPTRSQNTTFVAGAVAIAAAALVLSGSVPAPTSGSAAPSAALTPRDRMNSRSESRLR